MKKLIALVCAIVLTVSVSSVFAQDEEANFELASKVIPVEVFACTYNDGKGPSDLDEVSDNFNAYMDGRGATTYAAWTLTKFYTGPDQNFDFLWLGAWTDGNAMGADTDTILSTGGDVVAEFFALADCGVHTGAASINYKLPEGGTPGNSVLTFSNCSIEEGHAYPEVADAATAWATALTEAGSQAAIYHWFPVYGGAGAGDSNFTIVTAYRNFTDMGADFERMTNGRMFMESNALFGGLTDCDVQRVYAAQERRSAVLR